jgi:hypothetical protein
MKRSEHVKIIDISHAGAFFKGYCSGLWEKCFDWPTVGSLSAHSDYF